MVRTCHEEMVVDAVHERKGHEDRGENRCDQTLESKESRRGHRPDQNDADDECEIHPRREDLERGGRGGPKDQTFRRGNPSAFQVATTSSRPCSNVGYCGRHPKSRRNRAFEVTKDVRSSSNVYRPSARRASHAGICLGAGAPNRFASPPRNSANATGRSSTTCHTPLRGASAIARNAPATSSAWMNDQVGDAPRIIVGLRRRSASPITRVCHPSAA